MQGGVFHVEHLLPDAEPSEQRIEHVFGACAPDQGIKRNAGEAHVLRRQQGITLTLRLIERRRDLPKSLMLPLVECRFSRSRQGLPGMSDQRFAQLRHPLARAR